MPEAGDTTLVPRRKAQDQLQALNPTSKHAITDWEMLWANVSLGAHVPGVGPLLTVKSGAVTFPTFCPMEITVLVCMWFLSGSRKGSPYSF